MPRYILALIFAVTIAQTALLALVVVRFVGIESCEYLAQRPCLAVYLR